VTLRDGSLRPIAVIGAIDARDLIDLTSCSSNHDGYPSQQGVAATPPVVNGQMESYIRSVGGFHPSTRPSIRSGIVGSCRWLANEAACRKCLELDGAEVPLGTPFAIDDSGNIVPHPPLHGSCFCTTRAIVDLSEPIPPATEAHIEEMSMLGW
jgi:hypothetical protein